MGNEGTSSMSGREGLMVPWGRKAEWTYTHIYLPCGKGNDRAQASGRQGKEGTKDLRHMGGIWGLDIKRKKYGDHAGLLELRVGQKAAISL